MKTTSAELKKRAKTRLKGRYGMCVGAELIVCAVMSVFFLVYMMIMFFLGIANEALFTGGSEFGVGFIMALIVMTFFTIVLMAVTGLLMPGIIRMYYHMSTEQKPEFSDLLFALKNKPLKFLGLYMIELLIGFACAIPYLIVFVVAVITDYMPIMIVLLVLMYLVLLVGAVIASIYLSQSMYILMESTDKGVIQSIRESADMMKGNKGRLFYIYLSFIGMVFLGYFSFGVGFLWIFPYIHATLTEFYLNLKAEQAPRTYISQQDTSFESMWKQENQQ